jgi:hypothetical protein
MTQEALREFDLGGPSVDMEEHIGMIEAMAEALTDEHIARLWILLQDRAQERVEYGPDFDVGEEVRLQIAAVRAMRESVMPGGKVRAGVPTREMKEVVTASSTLLTTLLKTHEKIMSYDRQRAIEEATVEMVKTLSDEDQKLFFSRLEEALDAIS